VKKEQLSTTQPTKQVQVGFTPVALAIMNNSAHPLLVRFSLELPTSASFDYLIPSGQYTILPVLGHEFSFVLDILSPTPARFELPCTILLLAPGDPFPDFGASSYRQSYQQDYTIAPGDFAAQLIDTRGQRGLYFSVQCLTPASSSARVTQARAEVWTGVDVNNLLRTRMLMVSELVPVCEMTLPVSNNLADIRIYNHDTVARNYRLTWTVLDAPALWTPRSITRKIYSQLEPPAFGATTVFDQTIRAELLWIDVMLETTSPFSLTLNSGNVDVTSITLHDGFGFPLTMELDGRAARWHMGGRPPYYSYRVPLNQYIEGRWLLVLDTFTAGFARVGLRPFFKIEV
jgi:hypothetical protein